MKLDGLVIAVAACAPTALHLHRLGFYSDDWAFLAQLHSTPDQSVVGSWRALLALDNAVRPVQWLVLAGLYRVFGLDPLGYHLVNTALIALAAVLLYLCLARLGEPRLFVVVVPLLYAILPHYSTDRVWIAAMQANVSACCYFAGLYADLRAVAAPRGWWRWKAVAVACLVASVLAYEVFVPLIVLGSGFIVVRHWLRARGCDDPSSLSTRLLTAGIDVAALAAVAVVKAALARREELGTAPAAYLGTLGHYAMQGLEVSYGDHVLKIPVTLWQIATRYATWGELLVAGAVGLGLAACVWRVAAHLRSVSDARALAYAAGGILVCAAGSLFPLSSTMTGINNRTASAAAVGVALSLVGAGGWIALRVAGQTWGPRLFAAGAGVLGLTGVLTVGTVAGFWAESYVRQLEVIAAIKQRFPTLPRGTSLMLDGACPFHGPAIVFDSSWDLAGALTLAYDQPHLRADVLHARVRADPRGLVVRSYEAEELYPYDRLHVFHHRRREAYALTDLVSAQVYLADVRPTAAIECPPGRHSTGAQILGLSFRSAIAHRLRPGRRRA